MVVPRWSNLFNDNYSAFILGNIFETNTLALVDHTNLEEVYTKQTRCRSYFLGNYTWAND